MPTNNLAYTAPINPPSASPALTVSQIWAGLQLKVHQAEVFVPYAISACTVITNTADPVKSIPVVTRDIVFRADGRTVRETVYSYEPTRVDFLQSDGSTVSNVVSVDAQGQLHLTHVFEWMHAGASEEEMKDFRAKETTMAKLTVESSIDAIRRLVKEGKIQ